MKNENSNSRLWFMLHTTSCTNNKIETSRQIITERSQENTQLNIDHILYDDKTRGAKLIEEAEQLMKKAMDLLWAGVDPGELMEKYGNEAKKKFEVGKKLLGK